MLPIISRSGLFSLITFAYGMVAGSIIIDLKDKKGSFLRILSLVYFVVIANVLKIVF